MSTLKLVKRQVVQHKKFQFGTKNALFLYFWVVSLKSSVQKYKSLNLRPNMSFWVFLDYKLVKAIAINGISTLEFAEMQKKKCVTQKNEFNFGTKIALFGYFGL